jgi:hypothetical protein
MLCRQAVYDIVHYASLFYKNALSLKFLPNSEKRLQLVFLPKKKNASTLIQQHAPGDIAWALDSARDSDNPRPQVLGYACHRAVSHPAA